MAAASARDHPMPVSELIPPPLDAVFKFKFFNKVQSESASAFNSDANMTVSAPTGSGKTALFEMAICRLMQNQERSTEDTFNLPGKVVYLAPIKALCAEKSSEWEDKFSPFGINVLSLCSHGADDWNSGGADTSNADIILSTPEKFDSVTRSDKGYLSNTLSATVSLLLIDEMHHIGDPRGSALEAVVARMLLTSDELGRSSKQISQELPAANLRIIAVSATIPNVWQVAQWLRTDRGNCLTFSDSHRPVPLEYKVLGYRARNQWTFNQYLSSRCFEVVSKFSCNRPAIIFCTSRKLCTTAAKAFIESMFEKGFITSIHQGNALTSCLTVEERTELCEVDISDKVNAELVRHGVAVHHAAISDVDKSIVEGLFRRRLVRVMFTTTTLAQGVNLPARLCVILGTSIYQKGGLVEMDKNIVVQALGRAGRPQFDDRGVAIVMTAMQNVRLYEKICSGKHDLVKSQLKGKLPEHINAEIARGVVSDIATAVHWMRSTFFYVREKEVIRDDIQRLERTMRELVVQIVNDLAKYGIVQYDDEAFEFSPRKASILMARNYIAFETMKEFTINSNSVTSEAEVLKVLASAAEFADIFLRRSEKKLLNSISESIRFPLRSKVSTTKDKVFLLLQVFLCGKEKDLGGDFNLRAEMRKIVDIGVRISRTFSAYLVENEEKLSFTSSISALRVSRALLNGVFWEGGQVLRQLKGVGPALVQKIISAGVHSIRDLAKMDARKIENAVKKNPPFGNELLRKLDATIPCYVISVSKSSGSDLLLSQGKGGVLNMKVSISCESWVARNERDGRGGQEASRKDHRGFLLVGSHGGTVCFYEEFRLFGKRRIFEIAIPVKKRKTSKWVEICVAPENYCGADVSQKIHIPGSLDVTRAQPINETNKRDGGLADAEAETSPDEDAEERRQEDDDDILDLTLGSPSCSQFLDQPHGAANPKASGPAHLTKDETQCGAHAVTKKDRHRTSPKQTRDPSPKKEDDIKSTSKTESNRSVHVHDVVATTSAFSRPRTRRLSQLASLKKPPLDTTRDDLKCRNGSFDGLLPVKRLRDTSGELNTAVFAGTRLAAFVKVPQDETRAKKTSRARTEERDRNNSAQDPASIHLNDWNDGCSAHPVDLIRHPELIRPRASTHEHSQAYLPGLPAESNPKETSGDGNCDQEDSYSSIFRLIDEEYNKEQGISRGKVLSNVIEACNGKAPAELVPSGKEATNCMNRLPPLARSEQTPKSSGKTPKEGAHSEGKHTEGMFTNSDHIVEDYNEAFLKAFL